MTHIDLAHLARPRRLARVPEPETIPTKRCTCCKREKPLTAFAAHPRANDGHRRACKRCVKEGRTKPSPKQRAENTRRMRQLRKDNPKVQARNRIAVREWSRRNPGANRARAAVARAVKSGRLEKPARCAVKGCSRTKVEAHHPDYNAPLDVLWPCRPHHRQLHSGVVLPLKAGIDRRLARIPMELAA